VCAVLPLALADDEALTYQERVAKAQENQGTGLSNDQAAYIVIGLMVLLAVVIFTMVIAKIGPFKPREVRFIELHPNHALTVAAMADIAEREMTLVSSQLDLSRLTADAKLKLKLKKLRSKLRHGTQKTESQAHTAAAQRPSVLAFELELVQATDQAQMEVSNQTSKVDATISLLTKKKAAQHRKASKDAQSLGSRSSKASKTGSLGRNKKKISMLPESVPKNGKPTVRDTHAVVNTY